MSRAFRAVPLSDRGPATGDVSVSALSDLDALEQAREALGLFVLFSLHEGDRLVLTYRPVQRWGRINGQASNSE